MKNHQRWKITAFLVFTLLICVPFYILISRDSRAFYLPSVFALMWAPGVSALLVKFAFDRNLRGFGWKPGKLRFLVLGYVLPIIGGLLVYGLVWAAGLGELSFERIDGNVWMKIVTAASLGVLVSIGTSAGEEIGWRGFLVPELLERNTPVATALIAAAVWAVYHYPGILFSHYTSGTESWYAVLFFTLQIVGLTFIMNWMRMKSGSLWPAVVLHASHNLFIQSIFDGLTADSGVTLYITTDFGAGLALFYGAAAFFLWKRKV
ncbi:MAG: CPBP family intramembrane glutamic endopeptidase [Sediminispirochaetaceae bacterium]